MKHARFVRAVLVAVGLPLLLAACSGGSLNSFDPTDMLDFLDTKKKLPGDRRAVFPEGVPGVEPGVPKDMVKGANAEPAPPPQVEAAPPPPPAAEKPRRRAKPKVAAAPRQPAPARQSAPADEPEPADDAQPDGDQKPSSFPAPLPSGTFQR